MKASAVTSGNLDARIRQWLADLLQNHWVPREDYNQVQERMSAALYSEQQAREASKMAVEELHQEMDERYRSSFSAYERYADSASFKERPLEINRQQLPALGWTFRIDPMEFASMHDPKQASDRMKEYAAEKISRQFKTVILKELFAK